MTYLKVPSITVFTLSIPAENQAAQADYVGTVSGRDADKFAACGWTAVRWGGYWM